MKKNVTVIAMRKVKTEQQRQQQDTEKEKGGKRNRIRTKKPNAEKGTKEREACEVTKENN